MWWKLDIHIKAAAVFSSSEIIYRNAAQLCGGKRAASLTNLSWDLCGCFLSLEVCYVGLMGRHSFLRCLWFPTCCLLEPRLWCFFMCVQKCFCASSQTHLNIKVKSNLHNHILKQFLWNCASDQREAEKRPVEYVYTWVRSVIETSGSGVHGAHPEFCFEMLPLNLTMERHGPAVSPGCATLRATGHTLTVLACLLS